MPKKFWKEDMQNISIKTKYQSKLGYANDIIIMIESKSYQKAAILRKKP